MDEIPTPPTAPPVPEDLQHDIQLAYTVMQFGLWRYERHADAALLLLDPHAQRYHGVPHAQVRVDALLSVVHPDDRTTISNLLATAEPITDQPVAYRVIHPDGSEHWLAVRVQHAATATALVQIGIIVEITAQKQSEVALRTSESRFRLLAEQAQDLIYRYRLAPEPGFDYVSPSATAITGYAPEDHYADPLLGFRLVHPDDRPLLDAVRSDQAAAHAPLTLRWQRRDGSVIWTEQVNRVIYDPAGTPVALEGIARDITARKMAEEQVRAALAAEQAARQAAEAAIVRMSRLQAITAALAAAFTRAAVIAVITEHGLAAAEATALVVGLVHWERDELELVGSSGRTADQLTAYQSVPLSAALPSCAVVRSGSPLWLESPAMAERDFPGITPIMAQLGTAANATLPLYDSQQVLGIVSFSYAHPRSFSADDQRFLTTLVQQFAQALERTVLYAEVMIANTRLQAVSERLIEVQEAERHHLARELHDEIGQSLTGLSLMLTLGPTLPPTELHAQLAEAQRQVATLIAQVRRRSLDLRPSMLDDMGLYTALEWYLTRYSEQSGISLDVRLQPLPMRFPPLVELTAYRIVQEGLTNIARHAHIDRASVMVWLGNNELLIEIADEGVGFDVSRTQRAYRSSGLIGMRERVALLGGELSIESAPDEGTRLLANLPTNRTRSSEEQL